MRIDEILVPNGTIRRPVTGRFLVVRGAEGEVELTGRGIQAVALRAGDRVDLGFQIKSGEHIQIRDLSGLPGNRVIIDFTEAEIQITSSNQISVSSDATVAISNAISAMDSVSIAASSRVLLAPANKYRKELRIQVASPGDYGIWYGDVGVNVNRGALVEPGTVDFFETEAAVYAFNPNSEAVTVNLLDSLRYPDPSSGGSTGGSTGGGSTGGSTDRAAILYVDDYQGAAIDATLNSASSGAWTAAPGKIANDPKGVHGKVIKDSIVAGKEEWASGAVFSLQNELSEGEEIWYQFKILMPSGSDYSSSPHLKFVRFRTKKQDGSHAGYFDLYLDNNGDWKFIFEGNYNQGQGGWVHLTTDQSKKPVMDRWETYELHVVFDDVAADNGGKAKVEFWKNNELVASVTNMQTLKAGGKAMAVYNRTYWNGGSTKNQDWFWCESAIAVKSSSRDDSAHLITDVNGNKFIG